MTAKIKCNVENVRALADALEQGKIKEGRKRVGFNMEMWRQDEWHGEKPRDYRGRRCGTVCCVGGSARVLFKTTNADEALGLTSLDSRDLFYPVISGRWGRIPLPAAVEVLRHLADKGKIDWPRAIKLHPLVEAAK